MERLSILYRSKFGCGPVDVIPITGSASNRRYFRLSSPQGRCIGVIGRDVAENRAFISLADHFRQKGINVPEVFAVSEDSMLYIQEDLGDDILYERYRKAMISGKDVEETERLLCRAVAMLPEIQFKGGEDLDFGVCYPQPGFDLRSVMFDLNYFKYCFLKPSGLEFNEVSLQDDFERFAQDLLLSDTDHPSFLYRDFNTRNVMVRDNRLYFIDFQGGRRGPLYYDVASFIWHARSGFSEKLRDSMLEAYLDSLSEYMSVDREEFMDKLMPFVLFRTLQVLGAYGFRGMVEQKADFVAAIADTIENLRGMVAVAGSRYAYLAEMFSRLVSLPRFKDRPSDSRQLVVTVTSFSFKKGMPFDPSGNGGGYVFDCRAINNPGRHIQYKTMTGRDEPVIRFLEEDGGVFAYLDNVYAMVDPHVEAFVAREFTSLMVSFGCTGGQHRSVYCAESFARHIASKYPHVRVRLIHREQGGVYPLTSQPVI